MKTYLRCVFAVTMLALIIIAFLSVRIAHERIDRVTRLTQKAHRRIAKLEAKLVGLSAVKDEVKTQTKGVEHGKDCQYAQ